MVSRNLIPENYKKWWKWIIVCRIFVFQSLGQSRCSRFNVTHERSLKYFIRWMELWTCHRGLVYSVYFSHNGTEVKCCQRRICTQSGMTSKEFKEFLVMIGFDIQCLDIFFSYMYTIIIIVLIHSVVWTHTNMYASSFHLKYSFWV